MKVNSPFHEAEGEVTPLSSKRGKLLHSDRDRLHLTKRVVVLPLTSNNMRGKISSTLITRK